MKIGAYAHDIPCPVLENVRVCPPYPWPSTKDIVSVRVVRRPFPLSESFVYPHHTPVSGMQPRPLKIRACAWVTHLQFEAQHGGFGVLVEPDDRVGHAFQNADPNREKLGRDPAQPTEVAEYKSGSVWELMVLAPGRSVSHISTQCCSCSG